MAISFLNSYLFTYLIKWHILTEIQKVENDTEKEYYAYLFNLNNVLKFIEENARMFILET